MPLPSTFWPTDSSSNRDKIPTWAGGRIEACGEKTYDEQDARTSFWFDVGSGTGKSGSFGCRNSCCLFCGGCSAFAQTASRFLGTITAISGSSLTVKTDAGEVHQVDVPATAAVKRIAPGEKDLTKADTIQFSDLETGDRVLVKLDPNAAAGAAEALQVITVKAADVAQKQQKDREDWQRNGVGGLVKSVDASSASIVLTSGVGATAKTITIHTTKDTMLKRYAPASVRFDQATAAPIDAIHAGDQLRARGTKNADGTEISAVEVVSGSFRNISGTIIIARCCQFDAGGERPGEQEAGDGSHYARCADAQAGGQDGANAGDEAEGRERRGGRRSRRRGEWVVRAPRIPAEVQVKERPGGQGLEVQGASGGGQWSGQAGAGGGDLQQMLSRAPAIKLSDLNKGDAVMLVATDGATDVTAITLLAGVEPLLQAPAASQNLLNNWSMGSGAPDTGAQ